MYKGLGNNIQSHRPFIVLEYRINEEQSEGPVSMPQYPLTESSLIAFFQKKIPDFHDNFLPVHKDTMHTIQHFCDDSPSI